VKSGWQTEELTTKYLQGVRAAFPGAELQLTMIRRIVKAWQPSAEKILDLGCGDGILGRMIMETCPTARATFVDFSQPMLDALRAKTLDWNRTTIVAGDFSTPAWMREAGERGPFDVVVSGFAIHHQPDERKRQLYAEICSLLSKGGLFLNLEHVASLTPAGQELFSDYSIDNLFEFHRASDPTKTRDQIAAEFHNRPDKKENILAPVEAQLQWLRDIGFSDVDCFFKLFEIALFGGRRPSSAP
jgi:SAM-dependent methyltransferase